MKQRQLASQVKINLYKLISEAVDAGITTGVNRSFKHTDKPSREYICEHVSCEVMNSICEVIDFDG